MAQDALYGPKICLGCPCTPIQYLSTMIAYDCVLLLGGCERRIEVFVKIQKKKFFFGGGSGGGGGVRVDVNEELKFL